MAIRSTKSNVGIRRSLMSPRNRALAAVLGALTASLILSSNGLAAGQEEEPRFPDCYPCEEEWKYESGWYKPI